jgi:ABC-type sugar transport system substrate-binding protein
MSARSVRPGVEPISDLIVQGDFSYRSGLAAADALLSRQPGPSAIFASNDDMAAAALAVAHRHLDVPDDITVCGFDDTAIATTIWSELTARVGSAVKVAYLRDSEARSSTTLSRSAALARNRMSLPSS